MPMINSSRWQGMAKRLMHLGNDESLGKLGDFTTAPRVLLLSLMAVVIGVVAAFVALILLRLIGLFTNLFFYQRWGLALVSPAGNKLGPLEILVPVIGALIIGLMARYGSERIRGHGIPEAIEAILISGSKIEPKVAVLKPLSSALSIGTGGPFGAEGPIIMTGGAFGSMMAQFFRLTSSERKTLLVAGAAAGMSATFSSPISATLLAVELLLFEWKPRSLIPVALASVVAYIVRYYILGPGPLFPVPVHPAYIGPVGLLSCLLVGLLAGVLSLLLTLAVYAFEDSFTKLPIHWMWWPAIGGLAIGLGGLIFPQALGVGYDTIGNMLKGNVTVQVIVGVLLVKSIIWSLSLGSGTSGGVLAPLLMMGGALGGIESLFLPNEGIGFWPLISMGAILGGTMRVPFTSLVFVLELTHDFNALVPLMVSVIVSYCFTVLFMRRSILTEKISRRGYHLSREYSTDPLEIIFVREVMRTAIVALSAAITPEDLALSLRQTTGKNTGQRLYPVLDDQKHLIGVISRNDLQQLQQQQLQQDLDKQDTPREDSYASNGQEHKDPGGGIPGDLALGAIIRKHPVVAYPDEPLRAAINRMAATGYTRLPVVRRDDPQHLVGMVSLNDLLKGRARNLEEERRRERVLTMRLDLRLLLPLPGRRTIRVKEEVHEKELT